MPIYARDQLKKIVLASDDFGRADENPLAGGTNWKRDATQTLNVALQSGAIGGITTSGHAATYFDGGISWPTDQWVSAVVSTISDGDIGVALCIDPTNGQRYWYEHRTILNGGPAISYRDSAGTVNPLVGRTDIDGKQGDLIELWFVKGVLTAFVNGGPILACEPASSGGGTFVFSGGYPGAWRYNTSSRLSSWKAGGFGLSDARYEYHPKEPFRDGAQGLA